jgi:gamma-glutamyltranspeptidase/glutathione hydrolase
MYKKFVTRLLGVVTSGLLLPYAPGAEDPHRNYAGSATVSSFGIVATSQTLASQAGAAILERGGNAIDAAIAANAALGVIEPMMNGVGGDLFAIIYEAKTGRIVGINSSGWAPKGTSIEFLKAHGITGKIPAQSVQAVTVPGAVAGWAALREKFGKLSFKDDLAPAIFLAKHGIPIPEMDAQAWRSLPLNFKNRQDSPPPFCLKVIPWVPARSSETPTWRKLLRILPTREQAGSIEDRLRPQWLIFSTLSEVRCRGRI